MREKLNSDPKFQIGAVIVLILVAVVMLKGVAGGGGESEEAATPTEATVSIEGTGATGTATGATPGEAVEGAIEGAVDAAVAEAPATISQIPTRPLPPPVAAAYDAGKVVVLVIVDDGKIDDKLVATTTSVVAGIPEAEMFVVQAKQIADYGAITLGIDVDRVPALVVVRPRNLSDGTTQASVIYGFQSGQAVAQAVRDASYDGPEATYNPN